MENSPGEVGSAGYRVSYRGGSRPRSRRRRALDTQRPEDLVGKTPPLVRKNDLLFVPEKIEAGQQPRIECRMVKEMKVMVFGEQGQRCIEAPLLVRTEGTDISSRKPSPTKPITRSVGKTRQPLCGKGIVDRRGQILPVAPGSVEVEDHQLDMSHNGNVPSLFVESPQNSLGGRLQSPSADSTAGSEKGLSFFSDKCKAVVSDRRFPFLVPCTTGHFELAKAQRLR